jgi:hypothetical protein
MNCILTKKNVLLVLNFRKEMLQARQDLAVVCKRLTDSGELQDSKTWCAAVKKFKAQVLEVNVKIDRFNLIVPFLTKQKVHYMLDNEVIYM